MRPDPELKTDVIAELGWDPAINATAIDVHVAQGVVRLTGHVTRLADRTAIERAVRRVYGVRSMVLDLDVKLTPLAAGARCDRRCRLGRTRRVLRGGRGAGVRPRQRMSWGWWLLIGAVAAVLVVAFRGLIFLVTRD